jgi:hypothetical protein
MMGGSSDDIDDTGGDRKFGPREVEEDPFVFVFHWDRIADTGGSRRMAIVEHA